MRSARRALRVPSVTCVYTGYFLGGRGGGVAGGPAGVLDGAGIAGFGPAPHDNQDGPPPLPPLFLSLANVSGDHGTIGTPVPRPRFSFLTGNTSAELQLGGIDPAALAGPLVKVRSLDTHTYAIPIAGVSLGGEDIIKFSKSDLGGHIPGILDSGTTI